MTQTKQEIIRQIQQGKVQSALEGMVQLSGVARDKEVQQRCVLLQSQLSQLNTKFGMGTFDNKTYQLELNRITQAALEIAYDMPAVVQATPQYNQTQYSNQASSGSGWKTWGILLTGALGVIVLLVVINQIMTPDPDTITYPQTSFNNPQQTTPTQQTSNHNAANVTPAESKPPAVVEKAENPQDKFIGSWQGTLYANGIPLGMLKITLQSDQHYVSQMLNPDTGEGIEADRGNWQITGDGLLNLASALGAREEYSVQWIGPNAFNGTLVRATNEALIGMRISFIKY